MEGEIQEENCYKEEGGRVKGERVKRCMEKRRGKGRRTGERKERA